MLTIMGYNAATLPGKKGDYSSVGNGPVVGRDAGCNLVGKHLHLADVKPVVVSAGIRLFGCGPRLARQRLARGTMADRLCAS